MFPIDSVSRDYDQKMLARFDELVAEKQYPWKIVEILPKVLLAGEKAGVLTEEGAKLIDPTGKLQAGIPLCPPEGDGGTGMTATNSVAGVNLFQEFANTFGMQIGMNDLYGTLYRKALESDADCGGLVAYNYYSGEHLTGFEEGRPLFARTPDAKFTLANFMRTHLYSALATLKIGLDILLKEENVAVDSLMGHGGLFKTPVVGQRIMAAAMNAPVTCMDTASEGGAWGIAILARYMLEKAEGGSLSEYLETKVFAGQTGSTIEPVPEDVAGFEAFMEKYKACLPAERGAVDGLR